MPPSSRAGSQVSTSVSPPSMTRAAAPAPTAERAAERRTAAPSIDSIRRCSAQSSPITSRLALIDRASARPSTPIGPTSQAMRGTLMATAMIAHSTGVRVSCMA